MKVLSYLKERLDGSYTKSEIEPQLEYFFTMGKKERNKVIEWYLKQKPTTSKQRHFLNLLESAIRDIDYTYKIATIEPSVDNHGNIYYKEGSDVAVGMTCIKAEKKAEKFAPEFLSGLATAEEVFLWYGYRIAMGYWNISYACDILTTNNDDVDKKEAKQIQLSGAKKSGGAKDGVNNTKKITKSGGFFVLLGDSYIKKNPKPVTNIRLLAKGEEKENQMYAVPIITLRR